MTGYAVAIAIWTLGEIAHLPTANAVVADMAPTKLRGRYRGCTAWPGDSHRWLPRSSVAQCSMDLVRARFGLAVPC